MSNQSKWALVFGVVLLACGSDGGGDDGVGVGGAAGTSGASGKAGSAGSAGITADAGQDVTPTEAASSACLDVLTNWCYRLHECCSPGGIYQVTPTCNTHAGWTTWEDDRDQCYQEKDAAACGYETGEVPSDVVTECKNELLAAPCYDVIHGSYVVPIKCRKLLP